jgi:hypothetical protein
MKIKFIVCLLALLIISLQSTAQNNDRNNSRNGRGSFNREEFISKRNAYLVEKISLTPDEIAIFIPLDNELLRKKFDVGRECHQYERELRDKNDKSAEDYNKLLKCREEVKQKREQLDREYLDKFKQVLSAEKILNYQNADKAFMDEFIQDRK